MTNADRERINVLISATRGMNPKSTVAITVEDLNFLTSVALAHAPANYEKTPAKVIDGGFTKEAEA